MTQTMTRRSWRSYDERALTRRDRAWRDTSVVWSLGELDIPQLDAARAGLRSVLVTRGAGRLGRLLDADRACSSAVAPADFTTFVEDVIVADPTPISMGLGELAEREGGRPLGLLPFRLTLGPTWTTFQFNHALGDFTMLWPLYRSMMIDDERPYFAERARDPGRPLADALWHTFGTDLRRLRAAVQAPRAALPVGPDLSGVNSAGGDQPDADPVGQAVATAISDVGYRKGIRGGVSGAALPAIMIARAMRIATELGFDPYPGVAMVADCRRYLPSREIVAGNFCAGSYVPLSEPTNPAVVNTTIDTLTTSARPLLSMSLMAARSGRGPLIRHPWAEDPSKRSLISYSHLGRLPWPKAHRAPEQMTGLGRALGRYGLAVTTGETDRRMSLSVNFDPAYVDRSMADELAQRLVAFD